jgi:cytoskeletal protein CcmA (bactofilin family)
MMARGGDVLNGFIDSGCVIRGELEFKSSFRLDGRMEGHIKSSSELLIGETGIIEGEIDVARCIIGGEVRGTIRAAEQVVLHASAKVWAEIQTSALVMEEGAFLEGKVVMDKKTGLKAVGGTKTGTS